MTHSSRCSPPMLQNHAHHSSSWLSCLPSFGLTLSNIFETYRPPTDWGLAPVTTACLPEDQWLMFKAHRAPLTSLSLISLNSGPRLLTIILASLNEFTIINVLRIVQSRALSSKSIPMHGARDQWFMVYVFHAPLTFLSYEAYISMAYG